MGVLKGVLDVVTFRSQRPLLRLVAYYAIMSAVLFILFSFFPDTAQPFAGDRLNPTANGAQLLQDGLDPGTGSIGDPAVLYPKLNLALGTLITLFGTLALMLPVSWVYMSSRKSNPHQPIVAQTLLILPLVVAGVVLVVQNSLALAFSLAGVVAAVRFRTTLRDTRDVVFIFLAIAVGFAAGVQALMVGAVLSAVFNFLLLAIWYFDYGRNALEPTATAQWAEPLEDLARKGREAVPDRDVALALTPSKAELLARRFERVHGLLGNEDKKPKYNALLTLKTNTPHVAQKTVERVLDRQAKRWKLDQVVEESGKPAQLYYLIRIKKSSSDSDLLTAVRSSGGSNIVAANVELGEALAHAAEGNGKNGKNDKNGKVGPFS